MDQLSRDQLERDVIGQIFVSANRKYVLQGKLGDGAIGVVRRAINVDTRRDVAVKFLAPELKYIEDSSMEDISRRFKREGERGPGLDHSNLVEIISYEENLNGASFTEGEKPFPKNPFIVMEYVRGRTLENHIKKDKNIPVPCINVTHQNVYIAHEISKALVYLHKRGMVHRDVKPANIFLSKANPSDFPKDVKLGDFGIVKWGDFKASISTGTLTTVGQRGLGTLKYMASEQSLDPKNVGVQSDMYAFGITLFELFTNRILPDVHHVFQLRELRLERSTLQNKFFKLGFGAFPEKLRQYDFLFEFIFDMFLKAGSRPTSSKAEGMLNYLLSSFQTN